MPRHPPRHRGFTLPEMLAVIAIVVIIISMLLPTLRRARARAQAVVCSSNMHQLAMAHKIYTIDRRQILPRLEVSRPLPANPIVPFYGNLCWPDMLYRQYIDSREVFNCASAQRATNPNHPTLGIGLNHIQLSYSPWVAEGIKDIRTRDIASPSASILLADSGKIVNHTDPDADKWFEIPGEPTFYFLTPDHGHHFAPATPVGHVSGQRRPFNRHDGGTNAAHVDGHVEFMLTSKMGFQFWPGTDPSGAQARGDSVIGGGNDRYDVRWLWDRK